MAGKRGSGFAERCSVCSHEKVGIINYSLAKGVAPYSISQEYRLRPSSVYNHLKKHINENYKKIISAGVYSDLDELMKACVKGDAESIDILNALISAHFHQFELAFSNNSQHGMTSHSIRLEKLVELRAKLTRELQPSYQHVTNNTLIMGDVTKLLQILKPYPEACEAILAHYRAEMPPREVEHVEAGD